MAVKSPPYPTTSTSTTGRRPRPSCFGPLLGLGEPQQVCERRQDEHHGQPDDEQQPCQSGRRAGGLADRLLVDEHPRVLPHPPTGYHRSDRSRRENPCDTVPPAKDQYQGGGAGNGAYYQQRQPTIT